MVMTSWIRRAAAAGALMGLAWFASADSFAQGASIVGTWGARASGQTFPVAVTLQLLPTGQFQEDLQSATTACLHSVVVGNFGLIQQPNVYRFNITGQEPTIDCTGNPVVRQIGWTVQLGLVNANTLNWHDMETGASINFRRLR